MAATYTIADEPQPSGLAHRTVNPVWPLFGMMFVGPWFSWPWFVFNAFAMGSPNRTREIRTAVLGVLGGAVVAVIAVWLASMVPMQEDGFDPRPYVFLAITVWQLGVSYYLYVLQSRTFELYEYFGGPVSNGLLAVIAGALLGPTVSGPVWQAVPLLALVLR